MQKDKSKIFISYARADSEFTLKLAKDLRSAGVDLWIDQLDISGGDRWDSAVEKALNDCLCLLVVLSPASVNSNNVMDEVSLALEEKKKVVPVLYRPSDIPFRFKQLQYVNFTESYDIGFTKLLRTLNIELPEREESHAYAPTRALSNIISLREPVFFDDNPEAGTEFGLETKGPHTLNLIQPYRIGTSLITNSHFRKFVNSGGYTTRAYWPREATPGAFLSRDDTPGPAIWPSGTSIPAGLELHPVVGICFYEAAAFIAWLQTTEPRKEREWEWRLPTEDMWEYAARGISGTQYPWGNDWDTNRCNSSEAGGGGTTAVNQYPAGCSELGCHDMAGNVWEFVQARSSRRDCVLRGGSFKNNRNQVRSDLRLTPVPKDLRALDFGFRIACVRVTPRP